MQLPIAVLMATYNGARYLPEQLASLWSQTRQDFELIVRDDGSTDGTMDILREAVSQRPSRVRLVDDRLGRLGPKSSFGVLLQHTDSKWIAFCDQDDYWIPDKLARQAAEIERLESADPEGIPVLCCSDAAVTDRLLRITEPSYLAKHRISTKDGRDLRLARLLFRNYAIGTTTMINRALALRSRPIPEDAIMHDWWCALIACVSGRTIVLPEALVHYRQHIDNAIGSRLRLAPRSAAQLNEYIDWAQRSSARCVRQAQALHRASAALAVSPSTKAVLKQYSSFASQSVIRRALTILRTRAFKPGVALNGLHFYACMTARV